jgi:hypothetical protein
MGALILVNARFERNGQKGHPQLHPNSKNATTMQRQTPGM